MTGWYGKAIGPSSASCPTCDKNCQHQIAPSRQHTHPSRPLMHLLTFSGETYLYLFCPLLLLSFSSSSPSWSVTRRFEPSQPLRNISGLQTYFNLSASFSTYKSVTFTVHRGCNCTHTCSLFAITLPFFHPLPQNSTTLWMKYQAIAMQSFA